MRATRNLVVSTGGLMLAALLLVLDAAAQCSVFSRGYGGRPWPGSSIGVLAGEGVSEADIDAAVGIWQRGCQDLYAAGRIPRLLPNRPGDRTVRVNLDAWVSPTPGVCGTFKAASITIWSFTVSNGKARSCGPVARLIAHELGHVLGLGDAPARRECSNHVMSPIWADKLLIDRALPGECEIVAAANVPGLGLEGLTTERIATDLGAQPEPGGELIASELVGAKVEERATLAEPRTDRLARFLEHRRAARRGLSAARSVP
jgi:hypothetical protein